jgi:hypothetical protein
VEIAHGNATAFEKVGVGWASFGSASAFSTQTLPANAEPNGA